MNKEILNLVYTLESELDDAYNCLPEYRANVDSQSCIDYARSTLYDLKDKLEKLNESD
jgi:hypothetical protein